MNSRPRKSTTWTTVAVTIAAAVTSALILAATGAGSLNRLGSEGRHATSLGAETPALGRNAAGTGTEAGRDARGRPGLHQQ